MSRSVWLESSVWVASSQCGLPAQRVSRAGFAQAGPTQVRIVQISTTQVGLAQIGPAQVGCRTDPVPRRARAVDPDAPGWAMVGYLRAGRSRELPVSSDCEGAP